MKLDIIEKLSLESLDYMERVVNNGSKSGFTFIHTTSRETSPLFSEGFYILRFSTNPDYIKSYGDYRFIDSNNCIYVHPDWKKLPDYSSIFSVGTVEESFWVVPTSSARTVHIMNSYVYLKLYYPGEIGRLNRELKYSQLISGIEISQIFEEAKKNNELLFNFDFLPEPYGRIFKNENNEIGFLIRIIPKDIANLHLIPAFSMFSNDRQSEKDACLLAQILEIKDNPLEYLLTECCFPLVDIFFMCVSQEGLIPEMHSQNILFAFDDSWELKKIILRDFESIEKDICIRKALKKDIEFSSFPYKCISSVDENYHKRYSFMFDHKLCEYLLDPLVHTASSVMKIDPNIIKMHIKDYTRSKYNIMINELFPKDGNWYKYPDKEIDRTKKLRPYISMGEAIFR